MKTDQVKDACAILRERFGADAERVLRMEVPLEESVCKFVADLDNQQLTPDELVAEYLAANAEYYAR